MKVWTQLRLLLHRNFILRKRQPVILCLELLWPILIFLSVMAARWSIQPVDKKTCRYSSWALPTVGSIPFFQSLICNIDNNCLNETEFEEVPSYAKSSIEAIVDHLNPLMSDEKITTFLRTLPSAVNLLRATVDTLSQPEVQDILEIGIPVKEILRERNETEAFFTEHFSLEMVKFLQNCYLKIPELVSLLISYSESPTFSLCDHQSLYKVMSPGEINEWHTVEDMIKAFCNLNQTLQHSILRSFIQQIDVENVILQVSKVMSYFGRQDISSNLYHIGVLLQNLKVLKFVRYSCCKADHLEFIVKFVEDVTEGILHKNINFALLSKVADDFSPLYEHTDWVGLKTMLSRIASFFSKNNNMIFTGKDKMHDKLVNVATVKDNFYYEHVAGKRRKFDLDEMNKTTNTEDTEHGKRTNFLNHFKAALQWQVGDEKNVMHDSILQILHLLGHKLEQAGVDRSVFHIVHSVLRFLVHKTENISLSNNDSSIIVLEEIFPAAPQTRKVIESMLPHLPQIISTLFWSSLTSDKLIHLVEESHQNMTAAMNLICNQTTDYLYNPAFQESDWQTILSAFCSHNYFKIFEEIFDDPDVQALVFEGDNNEDDVEWDELNEYFLKFLLFFMNFSPKRKMNETYVKPNIWFDIHQNIDSYAQNTSVILHILSNSFLHRLCYLSDQQTNNSLTETIIPKSFLCQLSSVDFTEDLVKNISSVLEGTSRYDHHFWMAMYSSIVNSLKPIMQTIFGPHAIFILENLESKLFHLTNHNNVEESNTAQWTFRVLNITEDVFLLLDLITGETLTENLLDSGFPFIVSNIISFLQSDNKTLDEIFKSEKQSKSLLHIMFPKGVHNRSREYWTELLIEYFDDHAVDLINICAEIKNNRSRSNQQAFLYCHYPPSEWKKYFQLYYENNNSEISTPAQQIFPNEVYVLIHQKIRDKQHTWMLKSFLALVYEIRLKLSHSQKIQTLISFLRFLLENMPEVFEFRNNKLCFSDSSYVIRLLNDILLKLTKMKIDLQFLLCNLTNKDVYSVYAWLSDIFSVKSSIFEWKELYHKNNSFNLCSRATESLHLMLNFTENLNENIENSDLPYLKQCMKNAINGSFLQEIKGQGDIFRHAVSLISKIGISHIRNYPTWKSLISTIISQLPGFAVVADFLDSETSNLNHTATEILRSSFLNLNWVSHHHFSSVALKSQVCRNEEQTQNILYSHSKEQTKIVVDYLCTGNNTDDFLNNLNQSEIENQLFSYQEKEFYAAHWLYYLLSHSSEIQVELTNAIHAVNELGIDISLEMFRNIVTLEGKQSLQKLIISMENLNRYLQPVFEGSNFLEFLRMSIQGLHSIESLGNLNFFEVGMKLKDLLKDTKTTEVILKNEWNFTQDEVEAILLTRVHQTMTFSKQGLGTANDCWHFNTKNASRENENVSEILCYLLSHGELITEPQVIQNVSFVDLIKHLLDLAVEGVLQKASLTYQHAQSMVTILKDAPSVLPVISDSITDFNTIIEPDIQSEIHMLNISTQGVGILGTVKALNAGGRILCGKPLQFLHKKFALLANYDSSSQLDLSEMAKLPSEFCQHIYYEVMKIPAAPIIWRFLKPLFLGKILYSPNTKMAVNVIKQMNTTFQTISDRITLLQAISQSFSGFRYLMNKRLAVQRVKNLISSGWVSYLVKDFDSELLEIVQATDMLGFTYELQNITDILEIVELLGNVSQCISFNRFVGFDSEEELEKAAGRLHQDHEFIAAIVFLNDPLHSQKDVGPSNNDLPLKVQYKIRMDVDNVPTTKALRYRWWRPYAYDDFFEDLRYLRGFVQLQDLIDSAIVKVYTENRTSVNIKKYIQQFPYPCHQEDKFGTILKGSMPAVMTVSWIFIIAFLVREIVLERQVSLDEIMHVMGLRPLIGWLSWLISGLLVLSVSVTGIVVILKFGAVMPHSNSAILFIFFLIFAVLLLSYCYLISVFFKNASAAALIAIIIYVLSFFPFLLYITWEVHFFFWQKILACCLVATAFCFGCLFINRFEDQGEGIQWSNIWTSPVPDDGDMSLAIAMIIMMICSIIYFVTAWYISKVWPVGMEFTKQPWYFFVSPTYWGFRTCTHAKNMSVEFIEGQKNFLKVSDSCSAVNKCGSQEKYLGKIGIAVRNLDVIYLQGSHKEKKAVDNLTVNFYENCITTLLGKNGAGKTTTIKVLTGRCQPTHGEVTVCGIHMTADTLARIRKFLGYCPQHNILYEKLSVQEHLCFFANLKGALSKEELKKDVDEMLSNMGLMEKQNELTSYLSGGQKRRLCVALAFIGGSKVIILDEPTSSVDPVSRRDIWDLIVKYKKGRTIILCTHHLDEADILSDHVAIMHKGKLLRYGSPLELKHKYGHGYVLSMAASPSVSPEETKYSRKSYPELCDFDKNREDSNKRMRNSKIMEFIQSYVSLATAIKYNDSELVVSLPNQPQDGEYPCFSKFFEALDRKLDHMGFCNYSLSSTSLEQVFLTLCTLEDQRDFVQNCETHQPQIFGHSIYDNSESRADLSKERNSAVNFNLGSEKMLTGYRLKIAQLYCLLKKRYEHTKRNWKTIMCTITLPCLFIALAMSLTVGKPKPKTEPALLLNPKIYSTGSFSFVNMSEHTSGVSTALILDAITSDPSNPTVCSEVKHSTVKRCQSSSSEKVRKLFLQMQAESNNHKCICKTEKCLRSSSEQIIVRQHDVLLNLTERDVSQYLIDTYVLFNEKRYGGWTFARAHNGEEVAKVWFDNSGYHAMPSYLNNLNSAILKANMRHTSDSQEYGITTFSHPLHLSSAQLGQETLLHRLSEVGIAFVFLIGLSLIPSSFSVYIISERVHEERRLQRIAGVGPLLYWSSCILWDMFIVMLAVIFSALVIISFSLPTFVNRENFLAVISLIFFFGWATTPLTYLLSKFFEETSLAFMVLFSGNLFVGLIMMLAIISLQLMALSDESHEILDIVKSIAVMFPQYSLVGGIADLAQNQIQSEVLALFGQDSYVNPFTSKLLLPNLLILALQGITFFIINVLSEWSSLSSYLRRKPKNLVYKLPNTSCEPDNKFSKNDILKVHGLEKVYKTSKGKKYALQGLTLRIPKGECFGLLGVNGAGKTTLFKVLTGHTFPSKGEVMVNNKDIFEVMGSEEQLLGYCPQADALDYLLTAKQHFYIYARLRGVPQEHVTQVVSDALTVFDLHNHADCQVHALSGGNKRKICMAIAMLGNPQLILLDEPTSGMDPVSRRIVWERIRCATHEQRSVILSSHSIEECDILCSRIGIMVNGRFCALGTPHELKQEHGIGYTVIVKITNYNWMALQNVISKYFSEAKMKEHHCNTVEFCIPHKGLKSLSKIFKFFEEHKYSLGIEDVSIDQTTLDQVFIDFSRQQTDDVQELPSSKDFHP